MDTGKETQVQMHKDFFDKASDAIEGGYYLEAVFLEYAAIEGRLEIILGLLGCPCNKELPAEDRKKINISHRINCLKHYYKQNLSCTEESKLDRSFFYTLDSWIYERNIYVHGLYKNAAEYTERQKQFKSLAEAGRELSKKLYNEAKRLRRLMKASDDIFVAVPNCKSKKCSLYREAITDGNL